MSGVISLSRWSKPTVVLLAAGVAYAIVGLLTLDRAPLVWMDEPWYTQPAWSFATNGTFAQSMFPGLDGLDESNVAYGRLYLVAVAGFFKLLGLGPFQARLVSLIAGLAALWLTYLIGRRLWNAAAGGVATGILLVSQVFWFQTHDARPELMLVGFFLGALYLVLRSEADPRPAILLGAGLVAGLGADVHLNGVVVPFAVASVLAIRSRRSHRARAISTFGAGWLAGWAWWIASHILPNPSLFSEQWTNYWAEALPVQNLFSDPTAPIVGELGRYLIASLGWWPVAWMTPLLAAVAFVVLATKRKEPQSLALLAGFVVVVILSGLFIANKSPRYAVLAWPILALGVGRWATDVLPRRAGMAVVAITVAASLCSSALVTSTTWRADYAGFVGQLRTHIPDGATVQGEPTYWFAFADRPYIADHYFKQFDDYESAIRSTGVEFIVADEFFLTTQLEVERSIDADQVHAFLRDHTVLVAEVTNRFYGYADLGATGPFTTRIYRVLSP